MNTNGMKDENGKLITEADKIRIALELLSDACCVLFETHDETSHALAFMVDAALKYGQVISDDGDVLSAAADYATHEKMRISK